MQAPMHSLELPNPALSCDDACRIAREHWGLDVRAAEIGSTQDQNFRVTAADGASWVLKVANPGWRRAELEMQNAAMRWVAARVDGAFAVPVPVAARDGAEIVRIGGHDVRLVTWVPGTVVADLGYVAPARWHALGRLAARSAVALDGFEHAELDRALQWDTRRAPEVIRSLAPLVSGEEAELVARVLAAWDGVAEHGGALRTQAVHNDATDYNVVARDGAAPSGLLDFGDTLRTWRVCDPVCAAVSAAGHALEDPLEPALAVLAGYHAQTPLDEAEADVFWPLVLARAAVCALSATQQARLSPGNALTVRAVVEDWAILRALAGIRPPLARAAARAACGFAPSPEGAAVARALAGVACVPVVDRALVPIDLSPTSEALAFGEWLAPGGLGPAVAAVEPPAIAAGRWGEARLPPCGPGTRAPATLHLGADLFAAPGTAVRSPLAGTVTAVAARELELACPVGATTVHVRLAGITPSVAAGDAVAAGAIVARIAAAPDGPLPPHVHVQASAAPGLPGLGHARERAAWLALCPDPSPLVGADVAAPAPVADPRERRRRHVAAAQRLYYDEPPRIVRGWRHHLYGADGRPYLDAVNNVAVVGHSHPGVAAAATRGFRLLNTNSRFLYDELTLFADRLAALLPDELGSVFLVNSGSEAVDLALRLARAATGRRDVVALQGAYHGWTVATDELCTSPFDNPRWQETLPPHVHLADQPDPYRGRFGDDGPRYAESVRAALDAAAARGGAAAFVCEPLLGNQGGIPPATGYLAAAYAAVRGAGAVCIADEVQVGYGRTGDTFWAFEAEGVVPDIVCVAKAVGNGHPVGAVMCRREIADAFAATAPFFSSTGGGPVSCRIGVAVLDAIEQERLQENARRVGARLRSGFERLAAAHPLIGAVHGRGLYLGVDLVRDRESKEPAAAEAMAICERMRALGVIVQPTGDASNVLKVKPPLCIDDAGADHLLAALEQTLRDGW